MPSLLFKLLNIYFFITSRLLTLIAGFGKQTFSNGDYFFWIPWIVPHFGALIGAFTYFFLIEYHHPKINKVSLVNDE